MYKPFAQILRFYSINYLMAEGKRKIFTALNRQNLAFLFFHTVYRRISEVDLLKGSYSCIECEDGFGINGTELCLDIDECSSSEPVCDPNAICTNSAGSYSCACKESFFGNGVFCARGQCSDENCPENQSTV